MDAISTKKKMDGEDARTIALRATRAWVRELGGRDRIGVSEDVTVLTGVLLEGLLRARQRMTEVKTPREEATVDRLLTQISRQLTKLISMLPVSVRKGPPAIEDLIARAQRRRPRKNVAKIATEPGADALEITNLDSE